MLSDACFSQSAAAPCIAHGRVETSFSTSTRWLTPHLHVPSQEASCQAVAAAQPPHGAARAPSFTSRVLFTYADPVSPHVAAAAEQRIIPDDTIITATRQELQRFVQGVPAAAAAFVVVETAGGVASPGPSGTLQVSADCARESRLGLSSKGLKR
jgi:hypothetical protein